jgi:hypothetical protein
MDGPTAIKITEGREGVGKGIFPPGIQGVQEFADTL